MVQGVGTPEGDVQLPSGIVVPKDVARDRKKQVRWSRSEFKTVSRAARFLGSQKIKLAMMCEHCNTGIQGTVEGPDRVWECECTVRRVEHRGSVVRGPRVQRPPGKGLS